MWFSRIKAAKLLMNREMIKRYPISKMTLSNTRLILKADECSNGLGKSIKPLLGRECEEIGMRRQVSKEQWQSAWAHLAGGILRWKKVSSRLCHTRKYDQILCNDIIGFETKYNSPGLRKEVKRFYLLSGTRRILSLHKINYSSRKISRKVRWKRFWKRSLCFTLF